MIIDNTQLNFYHSIAAIGPTVAAFPTTYMFYGKQGVYKLLGKLHMHITNKQTILFIISPLLFFVIGLLVYPLFKGTFFDFETFTKAKWSTSDSFIIWILPSITYSVFEEIGWRGFLLPHLQETFSAWKATIILTVIWALWHVPFFFYRFDFSIGIAIGFFFGIFVGSIILTSIYNSSRGFILPVIAFHFLNNLCSEVDKEFIVAVLSTGFIFIAIYIFKTLGKANLSKSNKQQNYFNSDEKTIA